MEAEVALTEPLVVLVDFSVFTCVFGLDDEDDGSRVFAGVDTPAAGFVCLSDEELFVEELGFEIFWVWCLVFFRCGDSSSSSAGRFFEGSLSEFDVELLLKILRSTSSFLYDKQS